MDDVDAAGPAAAFQRRYRLGVQDAALSRRKPGFESRYRYQPFLSDSFKHGCKLASQICPKQSRPLLAVWEQLCNYCATRRFEICRRFRISRCLDTPRRNVCANLPSCRRERRTDKSTKVAVALRRSSSSDVFQLLYKVVKRRRHSILLLIAGARRHRLPHHTVATGSTRGLAEVHEQQTRALMRHEGEQTREVPTLAH